MKHRIFIAVNLPAELKQKLSDYETKWPDLPARWTKKDNLHITLNFLGYLSEEEILEVCQAVKEVASNNSPFKITLKRVIYGPLDKKPPRMIWAEGEKSTGLGKLQKDLETTLLSSPVKRLKTEKRAYAPHITLARIKTWQWRQIEPEERPQVNEEISLSFEVNSIEVMESRLKRGGPEYSVLESIPLKA